MSPVPAGKDRPELVDYLIRPMAKAEPVIKDFYKGFCQMARRPSYRTSVLLGISALFVCPSLFGAIKNIDTPSAILRVDDTTCDLVGVSWKLPTLEIISEPKLGESFRILLPKPDLQTNYFNSRDQKVSSIDVAANGVTCSYRSLRNDHEEVPVEVQYKIQAIAGQLLFSIEVNNHTNLPLAEVYYGILGGLQGIGERSETEAMIPSGTDSLMPHMFTNFRGGGLGIAYDNADFTYPGSLPMGWIDVYSKKRNIGYYYANQDPDTRLTDLHMEMHPYTRNAAVGENWPIKADLPAGEPVGITIGWVNFPYTANGTFKSGPIALQVHNGDWHTASGIYRAWFDQHFTVKRGPDWMRKEMAWQSVILSSPEDEVFYRFKDLPKLAEDAKKYGITTFEILGWNIGGIDRGYPQYQPDPKLGTPEEFRNALAEIRKIGVHPVIFSNVQVADTATEIFHNKLFRHAVNGRWAPDWTILGWGETTIGARLGFGRSNMTFVSPSHPEFRTYLMNQYMQLVRDGAEGFQLDKTGAGAVLDFNPSIPTSPDRSMLPGLLTTFDELLKNARSIDPDFSLASEIWIDRALPYVDVSYMRLWSEDMGSPALRYTFPEWTATIFGESPGDFNPMNNGMRYGLVFALAPRHYRYSVDEPLTRPLARYVSELIRIRKQYQDLLFFGRFNDTLGADVTAQLDVRYSVFNSLDPKNHDRAAVLVNFGNSPETATLKIPGRDGETIEISEPFEKDRTATLPLSLTIPPRRCVVVVSRGAN